MQMAKKDTFYAPEGLKVGQTVLSGSKASPEVGNAMFLKDIPLGTIIHNIEMTPGKRWGYCQKCWIFCSVKC